MPKKPPYLNPNPPRVDVVLFTLKDNELHIALFKRTRKPEMGVYGLPGGFVHEETDDTLLDVARRVLLEKTGLEGIYLEELCSFSGKLRDPRRWSMSIAHFAVVNLAVLENMAARCGASLHLVPASTVGTLPFDHAEMVEKAVDRLRSKSEYSTLPIFLCGKTFSFPELQVAYEAATGKAIKSHFNFKRKLLEMAVIDEVEEGKSESVRGRKAQLYRLKSDLPTIFNRSRGLIS